VASRGTPTQVKYVNNMVQQIPLMYWLINIQPTDSSLADPLGQMDMSGMIPAPGSVGASNYAGSIPAVPHLHGGEVPPVLDGGPDAGLPAMAPSRCNLLHRPNVAAAGNEAVYTYPNTQEAGPLWFHDHTLGATRLMFTLDWRAPIGLPTRV